MILIVTTSIKLILDYENLKTTDRVKQIFRISIDSIIQILAIVITFFMASRRSFDKNYNETVERESPKNTLQTNTQQTDRSLNKRSKSTYKLVSNK